MMMDASEIGDYMFNFCAGCAYCCKKENSVVTTGMDTINSINRILGTDRVIDVFQMTGKCAGQEISPEEKFYSEYIADKDMYEIRKVDGGCVFLDNNLCSIHGFKPSTCASFTCNGIEDLERSLKEGIVKLERVKIMVSQIGKSNLIEMIEKQNGTDFLRE
jgi:Fe-S-cluster containining protein